MYNELSQLSSKSVGNNLETISYTYNIRGSLTMVNNPANLNGKLFGYELKYYTPASTATGKRSGNVEENLWKSAQDGTLKKYSYQYDTLNRLTSGVYTEPGAAFPKDNFYNEVLTYDLGGNISNLKRNGGGIGSTAKEIDDLDYVYIGNRLQTVTDSKDNLSGYPTGGGLFDYDLNGNMTVQADKGISNIAYNLLDLPSSVTQTNGTIQYLYRADGSKLRKTASGVTTDYVDGFQYEGNDLKFVPTSEGYFNFENNTYIYHYTDHLGNIRLSYTKNGSGASIIEESNFYPYGMKQENTVQTNSAYNYEQSGKEYQKETGWSDFGARMYMADIGRWGVIDPLAETTRRINPYNYALDNPVSYVDPDGRKAMAIDEAWSWAVPLTGSGWFTSGGRSFAAFDEFKENLIKESEKKNQSSGGDGSSGITVTSLSGIMFMQSYFGNGGSVDALLSMVNQLIGAGWKDPFNTKAKYSDLSLLLEKVPALEELYKITKAGFKEDCEIKSPAVTHGKAVLVNVDRMKNILDFAFTIGHEMYGHVFANDFFEDKFSEITHISKDSPRSFNFFQEVMGVSWELNMGATRYGVGTALELTTFYYGPNGVGHSQGSVDNVNKFYDRLKLEYKLMYQQEKNKLLKLIK